MADPIKLDLIHPSRQITFFERYAFLQKDWTASTFKAQLRSEPDTTTAPLIDFSAGVILDYAGTATVAAHLAAGRLTTEIYQLENPVTKAPYVDADNLLLSWLRVSLDVPSLAFVPVPEERGTMAKAWYDILRLPPSAGAEVVMKGMFYIEPGVTIP